MKIPLTTIKLLYTPYISHTDIFAILDKMGKFAMAQFCGFGYVFISINSHILKWKSSRGLTREI